MFLLDIYYEFNSKKCFFYLKQIKNLQLTEEIMRFFSINFKLSMFKLAFL